MIIHNRSTMRLSLLLLPLLAGCMPAPFPEDKLPVWEERPVEVSFDSGSDKVWEEVLTVAGDTWPIDRMNKGEGRVTTEWVIGQSDYIFNQYGGTRIPEKVRYRVTVVVDQHKGRTRVTVKNREQVEKDIISANLTFTGSIYEWIDVPSSCRKERAFLESVADALGKDTRRAELDLRYR
ncbi:MAG: outer membrane protein assembly factor BamC [Myxococcales bacterium]|nr:outer membrane protein assembly factor BamC [Myxococcales bacterium]